MRRWGGRPHPASSRYLLLYGGKFPVDSSWCIKTLTAPSKPALDVGFSLGKGSVHGSAVPERERRGMLPAALL